MLLAVQVLLGERPKFPPQFALFFPSPIDEIAGVGTHLVMNTFARTAGVTLDAVFQLSFHQREVIHRQALLPQQLVNCFLQDILSGGAAVLAGLAGCVFKNAFRFN